MARNYRSIGRGVGIETNNDSYSYRVHFTLKGNHLERVLVIPVSKANNGVAKNIKAAIDLHASKNEIAAINQFLKVPIRSAHAGTLQEELRDYLERVRAHYPHSTAAAYNRACNQLLKHLGGYTLQGLAEDPLPIYAMIESWETLTLKTIRNYLGPLRQVFARAVIKQQISRDPLAGFKPSHLVRGKQSDYLIDPYTESELVGLINAAGPWSSYFQAAGYTGLRPSELMGLEWPDVDLIKDQIAIERAVVERQVKGPKTAGSRRLIDLSAVARAAFETQRAATQLAGERVFIDPATGANLVDYETVNKALKSICKRAGIRYRPSEQFRHTYATNRLSTGANLHDIAEQMGHRKRNGQVSIEMILKHYGTYIRQADGMTGSFGTRTPPGLDLQAVESKEK